MSSVVVGVVVRKASFVFLGRLILLVLQGGEESAAAVWCVCVGVSWEWTPVFTVLACHVCLLVVSATAFAFS